MIKKIRIPKDEALLTLIKQVGYLYQCREKDLLEVDTLGKTN